MAAPLRAPTMASNRASPSASSGVEPIGADRAPHRLGRTLRASLRGLPQRRGGRGAVGQRLPERMVQHQRADRRRVRICAHESAKRVSECDARMPGGFAQRRQRIVAGQEAERAGQPRVDFRLRQRAFERRHHAGAHMEIVGREFEIEQRELGLLILRGGRQHVMRQPRRLGHGDVDHDAEFERGERLLDLRGVRRGVGRIGAVDPHPAQTVRMIVQHGLRKHVRRQQAGDHLGRGRGELLVRRVAPQRLQPGMQLVGALRPKLPVSMISSFSR